MLGRVDDSSLIALRRIGHARTATATVTATGRWRVTGRWDSRIECVVRAVPRLGHRVLRDQLDRASIGIVLFIAEGAGRCSGLDE